MRMLDLIIKKRNSHALTAQELTFIAQAAANGSVPDYQLAAFLMACFFNPLSPKETAIFTRAMAQAGRRLDFQNLKKPIADKHSTGGVGDGISLALAPLAASAGLAVPMMSGRGLGHTGGTLDKLEAVKNFKINLSPAHIQKQMAAIGVCMFGQTADLAPADKKLYALRDITGTIESRPLIIASILSKKYAEGIQNLVMDVKYGSGAFMPAYKDAKALARGLVQTAKLLGINCRALITNMDAPLGRAIGNANEVLQSVLILKGNKKLAPDFYELLIETAAQMLLSAGLEKDAKKAKAILENLIQNGAALAKFKEILKWQGADPAIADNPHKYFKNAPLSMAVKAGQSGYIARMDAKTTGIAAVMLGAGRAKMEDRINYGAGLWLHKKYGSSVKKGDTIAMLYTSSAPRLKEAAALFESGLKIQKNKPPRQKLIKEIII